MEEASNGAFRLRQKGRSVKGLRLAAEVRPGLRRARGGGGLW